MPPVLDPKNSKVDGLAFIGLSLTRKSDKGHPESETHQESFDFNLVQDRDYKNIGATNDDGWLVGGGEPGPPTSYKLKAKDSGHVEIIRLGTYEPKWGGIALQDVLDVMTNGTILIPQIEVLPTAVMANPDQPPELEVRFDMEPPYAPTPKTIDDEGLPINWQLRFLHNQLFKAMEFPSRFCPGPFHSTILRKAEFRSPKHEKAYFEECEQVLQEWRIEGPKPLNTVPRTLTGEVVIEKEEEEAVKKEEEVPAKEEEEKEGEEKEEGDTTTTTTTTAAVAPPAGNHSGVWLFTDRQNISHFFAPNFLPPYNTPEKKKIICDVLAESWDEKTLSWKPTPKKQAPFISNLMNKATTAVATSSIGTTIATNKNISNNIKNSKKKKEKVPIAKPVFDSNVSVQLNPSGKFLSVSNNGKLVLLPKWNQARCTFKLWRQDRLSQDGEEMEQVIGLQFAANETWVGINMFGNAMCVANQFCGSDNSAKREAWSLENDMSNTPLMNAAAGWGSGNYLMVEGDATIKLVQLRERKKAALWCIKNLE
ncbi:unnamed protein product [Cylindrotheca closterium]|uniref:Uncharacterized protein n=1 Tax=Cylindrotheca closterium TaxID=2856 RepID=A0AAD2GBL9_9STRA|nr:unnamed protein product [Cylindrotheca closterium]